MVHVNKKIVNYSNQGYTSTTCVAFNLFLIFEFMLLKRESKAISCFKWHYNVQNLNVMSIDTQNKIISLDNQMACKRNINLLL